MVCTSPKSVRIDKNRPYGFENSRSVPCGQCIACRIQRTSQWALRLMNELPYWNYSASFITLTYDDEHLPCDYGLRPKDLTDFWKRLRKDLDSPIKYYACGEYGDKERKYLSPEALIPHGRPHYHAIVFGFDYNEKNRRILKDNWRFCLEDRFDFSKQKNKEQGFAPVTPDDIRYVTGYIQKKLNGDLAKENYGICCSPFSRSSQGLGLRFAEEHIKELQDNNIKFRGHNVSIPRYYLDKLNIELGGNFGIKHKQEFIADSMPELADVALTHYNKKLIESAYDSLSIKNLEAYDKELRARYDLE